MTRILLRVFLAALLGTAAVARAQTPITNAVVFNLTDFTTVPQGARKFLLYTPGTFTNGAGVIITRDRIVTETGTNGSVTVSNVYGGDYRSELSGTFASTTNWYHFPQTNGVLNASDWVTAPTNSPSGARAWTTTESDGRYLKKSDVPNALTNGWTDAYLSNSLTIHGPLNTATLNLVGDTLAGQNISLQSSPAGLAITAPTTFVGDLQGKNGLFSQTVSSTNFAGNLAGATNLAGTNVDIVWGAAATTNGHQVTFVGGSSTASTNITFQLFHDGTLLSPTGKVSTAGSTTAGLQEALNAFTAGTTVGPTAAGLEIKLGAGYYYYTNELLFSNNFTTGIKITGNTELDTKLVYAGAKKGISCITIAGGHHSGGTLDLPMHVVLRDLGFSSITNATNILVTVTNYSHAEISACNFEGWAAMTNGDWGSAMSLNAATPRCDLVGLAIGNVAEHGTFLHDLYFAGLADGVYLTCDHAYVNGIKFANIGIDENLNHVTGWASNSIYSIGAGLLRRPGLNSTYHDAHFYGTWLGAAILNAGGGGDDQYFDRVLSEGNFDIAAQFPSSIQFLLNAANWDASVVRITNYVSGPNAGNYDLVTTPTPALIVRHGTYVTNGFSTTPVLHTADNGTRYWGKVNVGTEITGKMLTANLSYDNTLFPGGTRTFPVVDGSVGDIDASGLSDDRAGGVNVQGTAHANALVITNKTQLATGNRIIVMTNDVGGTNWLWNMNLGSGAGGGSWQMNFGTSLGIGDYGNIFINTVHGGPTPATANVEFQFASAGNFAFGPGFGRGGAGHIQFGIGTGSFWSYYQNAVTISAATPYGNSGAETFKTSGLVGGAQVDLFPGMLGRFTDTNTPSGVYELDIFPDLGAAASDTWVPSTLINGIQVYGGNKYGVRLNGGLIHSKTSASAGSSYALNFSSSYYVDISASATAVALSTTGISPGATNAERRVFYIRAGASSPTLTYPTGWNTNGPALPSSVPAANMLRLELEALGGPGETNVSVISAQVLVDHTFVWDQNALDFLGAAGITVSGQSNAVNQLCVNAKANGWWSLCDVIYPFVGGTATTHKYNLKNPAAFQITWNGTPTQDANGVTGNGSSMYGLTGYTPSSSGVQYVQNSAHMFVYSGTTTPTDAGIMMGSYLWSGGTAARGYLRRNGTFLDAGGLNSDTITSMVNASSDFRGPLIVIRTSSTAVAAGARSVYGTSSIASTASEGAQVALMCRYDQGGTADNFSTVNLRGASIGAGMSQAQWDLMRADWDTYEAALSRKVP